MVAALPDMKGSLAAMLSASRTDFLSATQTIRAVIAFLITSDEEDLAVDGTVRVMDELDRQGTQH